MYKNNDRVNIIESKFKGVYVVEDSGVKYIYDEATNDLHEASNLELQFCEPKRMYKAFDCEIDNWKAW